MIGTLRRAGDAVRYRDTDEGRRQRDVLRKFERESRRKRSAIVADLDREIDVGHDQYRRYLRGDTPLRLDQIGVFARVFLITKADLSRALGLLDDEIDPAVRERLEAAARPLEITESTKDYAARVIQQLDPATQDDLMRQIAGIVDAAQEHES